MSDITVLVDAVRAFIVLSIRPLIDPMVEAIDRVTNRINALHTDFEQLGSRISRLECEGPAPAEGLADKVKMLEDRCADLTKLLGRLIDTNDIQFTLDNRELTLSDEFTTYLQRAIENEAECVVDKHTSDCYHEASLGDLKDELRSFVRKEASESIQDFEWDAEALHDLIASRVDDQIDGRVESAVTSAMEDVDLGIAINRFFRDNTFDISVA